MALKSNNVALVEEDGSTHVYRNIGEITVTPSLVILKHAGCPRVGSATVRYCDFTAGIRYIEVNWGKS